MAITTYGQNNHSMINMRYRYILYENGAEELYDLQKDPEERNNIANQEALDALDAQRCALELGIVLQYDDSSIRPVSAGPLARKALAEWPRGAQRSSSEGRCAS